MKNDVIYILRPYSKPYVWPRIDLYVEKVQQNTKYVFYDPHSEPYIYIYTSTIILHFRTIYPQFWISVCLFNPPSEAKWPFQAIRMAQNRFYRFEVEDFFYVFRFKKILAMAILGLPFGLEWPRTDGSLNIYMIAFLKMEIRFFVPLSYRIAIFAFLILKTQSYIYLVTVHSRPNGRPRIDMQRFPQWQK